MNTSKNYYALLGVLPTADIIVIRAAYKALVQRYHPDRYHGDIAEANRIMAELNEAYKVLSDPELRKRYDSLRGESSAQDAGSFFDEDPVEDLQEKDPLFQKWEIAVEYYPDLANIERRLARTSHKLAYTYRAYLIASKNFSMREEIAQEMEQ